MTELREKLNNIVEEKQTKILPENLKAGVEAFGVQGNFTSDATATSQDILKDKTAYVNGEKVVGTLEQTGGGDYNAKVISITSTTPVLTKMIESISELDLSSATSLSRFFYECDNLKKLPARLTVTNCTDISSMFYGCKALEEAPQISGTKIKNFNSLYSACSNLKTVKYVYMGNAMSVYNMFASCPNLSDESLDKILQSLKTATDSSVTKTLKSAGLSQEQATRCQSLSNYQAFLTAGWTTGY